MTKKKGRILSVLLAAALTFTSMSTLALADEETQVISEEGLCEHHTEHTEDCGYDEAAGNPCQYVCELCGADEGEEQQANTGDTDTDTAGNNTSSSDEYKEGDKLSATLITEWSWADGDELQETDGVWGIGMPGANEDNPLTQDILLSMLPTQINATTADGENVVVDITWDLSSIPDEGIWSGDHTFTANLEGAYSLTEDASPLSVKVELGGAETYTIPTGTLDNAWSKENIVPNTIDAVGTTVNVFDYWIFDRDAPDYYANQNQEPNVSDSGINEGHAFNFRQSGAHDYDGSWNDYTNGINPRTGIVSNKLDENGYPKLNNLDTGRYGRDGNESLQYLFDPDMLHDGKIGYADVGGLLQINNDGYYYYDSTLNYATFYEGSNSFALYNATAPARDGQFFPFNLASDVFNERQGELRVKDGFSANSATMNHYFGVTMSTRFIQQHGGHVNEDPYSNEVTYEFSGDDDVWVFIDDVLVADVGGIHGASSLSINFATGQILINGGAFSRSTLKAQFEDAGVNTNTGFNGNTFADNTYHTLKFFYLERGNSASNMSLQFNLVTIPESSVIKVDQTGDPVQGAEFQLLTANGETEIAHGVTGADGEFIFYDADEFPISIADIYQKYGGPNGENKLILREVETPLGYRTNGDAILYFHKSSNGDILLLSENHWDTGTYAMAKVTASLPSSFQVDKNGDNLLDDTVNVEQNDTLFAVVMKKEGNDWYPVYGNPLSGWHVIEDSSLESIISAAKESPYRFQLTSSGAYQVTVDNIPGDIKTYYYINGQNEVNAEYTIAYFYSSASSLETANRGNTFLINPRGQTDQLKRVFSVDLYVTNIKNRLFVQKVDDEGTPVNGAEFALYEEEDVTVEADGTVKIDEGSVAYDSATTMYIRDTLDTQGAAVFPTGDKVLNLGEYYLIERSAPNGYILNENVVHVVVDNTGVYADAGTVDDGISVLRGVGSLVRSMVQFAVDDKVDATLNLIKTGLATGEYSKGGLTWEPIDEADWQNGLELQYANDFNVLDYGLIGANEKGDLDSLTLETEEGWSKLFVRQHYDAEADMDTQHRQDLGDQDLTNLFSGSVFVRVANQRVGTLRISKTVTAEAGQTASADAVFTFKVVLKDGDKDLTGISGVKHTADSGTETIDDVTAEAGFTLKDGEYIDIENLPVETEYEVQEVSIPEGFTPSVAVGNGQSQESDRAIGTISQTTDEDSINLVAYTNKYSNSVVLNGDTALKGRKTLEGRNLTAEDSFEFYLEAGDGITNTAIENGSIVIAEDAATASVTGTGTETSAEFSFGMITINVAGTYTFHVKEKCPSDATADTAIDGVLYDTHTATVTVKVITGENGLLTVEAVTYANTNAPSETDQVETEMAAFTNRIVAKFSFTKVDSENIPLSGAEFAVYQKICQEDHGDDLIKVNADGTPQNTGCWKLVQKAGSGADGVVAFDSLTVGTYRLVEIKAPGGYVLPNGQWTITYDEVSSEFIMPVNSSIGNPPAYNAETKTIINYQPGELPFSGNIGTKLFLIIGGTLMLLGGAGGAIWYKTHRRVRVRGIHRRHR